MTMWRMRIACWMPKATNTHSQYVILMVFPLQQWFHERVSMLRYTYIAGLVHTTEVSAQQLFPFKCNIYMCFYTGITGLEPFTLDVRRSGCIFVVVVVTDCQMSNPVRPKWRLEETPGFRTVKIRVQKETALHTSLKAMFVFILW